MENYLITTLGGTVESITKSFEGLKYKNIIIITTEEQKPLIEKIKSIIDEKEINLINKIIKDPDDPTYTFTVVDEEIKKILKNNIQVENIFINYTGGTKSMAAGIVLAAVLNCIKNYIYVGGKRDEFGRVITGFETIMNFKLAGIMIERYKILIKVLFNNYDFLAVQTIIRELETKHNIKKEVDAYINFVFHLSDIYIEWDKMQYEIANEKISKIKIQENLKKELPADFEQKLNNNKKALGIINKSKIFQILDKFASAQRNYEKGYYYLAAEMLYSLTEFIADYILEKDFNINKSDVDSKRAIELAKGKIDENYFSTLRSKVNNKIQMPLYHSFDLLNIFGNEIGKYFIENKEIQRVIKLRNDSVHNNKPITEKQLNEFLLEIKKLLNLFCKKYSEDKEKELENLIKVYEFVKI